MVKSVRKDYFEGILQLRNPTQELLDFVRNRVRKDNKAFIAKEEPVSGGIDLYLSSNHYLQNLGMLLKKSFPGELKISRRLYSRSHLTSRQLYRVNVMFRLSDLRKGQQVTYRGTLHEIVSLAGKVALRSTTTGKRLTVDYKDVKQVMQ